MIKNSVKIGMTIFTLMAIFIFVNVKPIDAATTTLRASNTTVNSEESFSITITSSIKLSGWTISVANNGGCSFISASGGEISGSSVYGTNVSGTTSLAVYKFKAPVVSKDTTYTITFSGTGMADSTDEVNVVNNTTCKATITVKAKSSSGGGNTSGGGSTTTEPKFTSVNETVYATGEANVRKSYSTSSTALGSLKKGESLTRTGKGDNGWSRVTYKGQTAYVSSSLLTTTKPKDNETGTTTGTKSSNKALASLNIKGVTLEPSFNQETTQYTFQIENDITKLEIEAKTEDSKAKVAITGNENLKEGDNIIKIAVTAEDETVRTYILTAKKGNAVATEGLKLAELKIAGVNFEDGFNPDTHAYELNLNLATINKLDITAKANQEDAKVEILGNENFVQGENVITILLTSADGKETATYQIKVILPQTSDVTTTENDSMKMSMYIIAGVIAVAIIIMIILFILRYRTNRKEKQTEEEKDYETFSNKESIEEKKIEEENVEIEKEDKTFTKADKKSKVSLDDFLNHEEDTEIKGKKSKGKHSN